MLLDEYMYSHNEKYNYFTEKDLEIRNLLTKRLFINKLSWNIILAILCIVLIKQIEMLWNFSFSVVIITLVVTLISIISMNIKAYILWNKIEDESLIAIYKKYVFKRWARFIIDASCIVALVSYCSGGWIIGFNLLFIPIVIKIIAICLSLALSKIRLWMIQSTLSGALEELEDGEYKNPEDVLIETFGNKEDTEVLWGTSYTHLIFEMGNLLKKVERVATEEKQTFQNKSYLITNLSHDLKTPLTCIINSVYILKNDDLTNEERKDQILILENKLLRLKNLIKDLSDMIDSQQDSISLNKEEIHIDKILIDVINTFEDRFKNSNLDLKINFDKDNIVLYLDKDKMVRVFENILSNIDKYSLEDTRVYIDIKVDEENVKIDFKNISKYEIEVDDKTIGNRFVKGDKSRNIEGHGLGLSIIKNLVKIQGGKVDINIEGDLFKVILNFSL